MHMQNRQYFLGRNKGVPRLVAARGPTVYATELLSMRTEARVTVAVTSRLLASYHHHRRLYLSRNLT